MKGCSAVDIDDLGDPVPVDELECLIIIHAFRGICIKIFTGIQDKIILIQFLRCQIIELFENRMPGPAEKLGRRMEQEMFLQVTESEKLPDLFRPVGWVHDKADVGTVCVEILDDLGVRHFPVEKSKWRVSMGVYHADKGIICVGTAVGGDPQTEGIGVLLEGLTEMVRMIQKIPAHIEKKTSGFGGNNSVFPAGEDREPVFFFGLSKNFAEIGLGHEEAFRGGGDGAAV